MQLSYPAVTSWLVTKIRGLFSWTGMKYRLCLCSAHQRQIWKQTKTLIYKISIVWRAIIFVGISKTCRKNAVHVFVHFLSPFLWGTQKCNFSFFMIYSIPSLLYCTHIFKILFTSVYGSEISTEMQHLKLQGKKKVAHQ